MEEIQIQYIFFIPSKKIQQVPQQEEQKNLKKMQKSGYEKLPNPLNNFLTHLNQLDKPNLIEVISNLQSEEEKEERLDKVSQTEKQNLDYVKFDEDDSELQRCRIELKEIERQQREKPFNSSLSETLFQPNNISITSLLNDSPLHNHGQKLYKEEKSLLQEFTINKSEQQESIIQNLQCKSNQQLQIGSNKWKSERFEQRQQIIFDYEPEQNPITSTKIEEDKPLMHDRKMIVVSENQMETSEQGKQLYEDQNVNNGEQKEKVEQNCPMMEIQSETPLIKQDKDLQDQKNSMNNTEIIHEEENNNKSSNQKQLIDFKQQPATQSGKYSRNTSKQNVLSKQSGSRPKVVEQLREQQVHKITQNLEGIFEIFKRKLPLQDQIEIIRALYLMYIGPENTEKHKPKITYSKTKDSAVNMNEIETNSFANFDISSKNQPTVTQKKSIIEQLESANQEFQGVSNQVHLEPRCSVMELPIPKRSGFLPAKNSNTLQKRAYTKRSGDGLGNPRYMDEQKVAMLFIKKGYGLHVARSNLGPNIQNNQYTNLVTTIIREAWRKIQDYVARIRRIKSMNTNEFKVIKTSLVNCVKWMDPTDLETFYGFMKFAYQMDNRQPYEQEAIKLYNSCIRRYEQLRGQYQTQMKVRMDKKVVQKLNPGQMSSSKKSYPNMTKAASKNLPKIMKNAPSDRQLEDLTSLIKSQLRQNNTSRPSIPNRPIQNNNSNMRFQLQQGINFARITQPSMNGQRK